MKQSKRDLMYTRIAKHGERLLKIYQNATERDPVTLCKQLRTLENRAHAIAIRLCNGPEYPGGYDEVDATTDRIRDNVKRLLGAGEEIKVNRDPRGYALKINDKYVAKNNLNITRDWGGYGILAPDFSQEL